MYEYSREVFYYETDKMGVVHHSNFIRWLEEARTRYFAEACLPYEVTEALGVLSPVIGFDIRFKYFARFGDRFTVKLKMTKYTGVRFTISFSILNQHGNILAEGQSNHAFISASDYLPVSLSKTMPDIHVEMKKHVEPSTEESA